MNGDETVGRYPDGSRQVYVMNVPTIAKTNIMTSYAVDLTESQATGISDMASKDASGVKAGKYFKNGRLIIEKGGRRYTIY